MRAGRGSGQYAPEGQEREAEETQVLDERPPFGAVGMDSHIDRVMMIESESIVNEGDRGHSPAARARNVLERIGRGW